MARCSPALLLLCALAGAALLEVAESNNVNKKVRDDALKAGKGNSPRILQNGTDLSEKEQARVEKRDRFAGCVNTAATRVETKRRKGNSPRRVQEKKEKMLEAASSCIDTASDACDPSANESGGRRLQELLAVDMRNLSPEETRQHLRHLLEAADDDEFETATAELSDPAHAEMVEDAAENLSTDDVDDFCAIIENPTMQSIVQSFIDPEFDAAQVRAAGVGMFASVRFDSNGRRIPLREHFKRLQEHQAQAQAAAQSVKPTTTVTDCRLQFGTGVQAIKASTQNRLACNSTTGLARSIIPNYPVVEISTTNGFTLTMAGISVPGNSFLQDTQATPGEQETRYKEYSDANQWGAEFEFASISELVVNNLEKVVAAFNGACDTAGNFYGWIGLFGGVKTSPGGLICKPLGLIPAIAVVIFRAALESVKYRLGVAGNHDLILQAAEVETITENTVTTIHNSKILYNYVNESSESTQTLVKAVAGETKVLIENIRKKIADLDARLTNLVQKRSCDLQNAAANNHNTLNHVQRLLLVPQGARPGYKEKGDPALKECLTTTPVPCSHATRNNTSRVNAGSLCTLGNELAVQTPLIQSSAVLPGLTVLPEKVSAQDGTPRSSP